MFLLLVVFLIGIAFNYPTQIKYEVGKTMYYNITGHVDGRGRFQSGESTSGSTSTLTGILAQKCVKQYSSDSWLVIMNMFDTQVDVGEEAMNMGEDNSQALGYDMYYEHKFDGEIPTIWYHTSDSSVLVQIKASAINTFQTKILPPSSKQNVPFKDPGGEYTAVVSTGCESNDGLYRIDKEFDQKSFLRFSDKKIKPENLKMDGLTTTNVHQNGFVHNAKLTTDITITNFEVLGRREDMTGFNIDMGSKGVLTTSFVSSNGINDLDEPFTKIVGKENEMEDYVMSDLLTTASNVIEGIKKGDNEIEVEEEVQYLIQELTNEDSVREDMFYNAKKLAYLLRNNVEYLMTYYNDAMDNINNYSKIVKDGFLFVLGILSEEPIATDMLVKKGLENPNEETRLQAIFSSTFHKEHQLSTTLRDKLWNLWKDTKNSFDIRSSSLLSFSLKIEGSEDGEELLLKELMNNLYVDENSETINTILYASKNARMKIPSDVFIKVLSYPDNTVKSTALSLKRYIHPEDIKIANDDFPFNISYTKDYKVGGDVLSATFEGNLFAGTNLDCNHEYFNYKALAELVGTGDFMGLEKEFLVARAIYGQKDGRQLDNEILLEMFEKIIYQKKIPSIDCLEHTYDIYHSSPGVSLKYILWISIVPVTFELDVNLGIDVKWGWNICLSKLTAAVELIPGASLSITGNVLIDLLIIRAGTAVTAKFGPVDVIPKVQVDGTLCQVEFDVDLDIEESMTAELYSYYQWKKCKFLIFDCKWGSYHKKSWWNWESGTIHKNLYQHIWKIA